MAEINIIFILFNSFVIFPCRWVELNGDYNFLLMLFPFFLLPSCWLGFKAYANVIKSDNLWHIVMVSESSAT